MKIMTVEEIEAMVGTEFIYVFGERGNPVECKAIVAAFDPGVGFTCLATDDVCSGGYEWDKDDKDENGNVCLVGMHSSYFNDGDFMEKVTRHLRLIKATGYYVASSAEGFGMSYGGGDASCAFG